MLRRVNRPASFVDRYLPHAETLRLAWEAEAPADPAAAAHAFFDLLGRDVRRLIFAGEHAALPALFAEVERSLESPDLLEAEAVTTPFLEDLLDGAPELLVHLLPWLGPRSLAALRAWHAGAQDPFLSARAAESGPLAVLTAACPAMTRAWSRAAVHISARDGTTSPYGLADLAFEVVRAALAAADDPTARALLIAIDGLLAPTDRVTARAFERCFLERLRELSLADLDRLAPHLGPRARTYWRARLRLGEPRFGVWDERPRRLGGGRLVPATVTARGDAWGWRLSLPRGDLDGELREQLFRDGALFGEDTAAVGDSGDASSRWTWSDDDPAGDYTLELRLGARLLGSFAFALR